MSKVKISSKFERSADCVLYHGNCLTMLSGMPDNLVKLIVTSPPYNIGKSYEKSLGLGEYLEEQRKVIRECVRVLHDNGSICWQVGNYVNKGEFIPLDIILYPIFDSLGMRLRNRIIWHFGHGLHASKRFSGRYEVILWFTKGNEYTFNIDAVRVPQKYPNKKYFKGPRKGQFSCNPLGKNPGDVWEVPNVKANHVEKTLHPCQFPVELIERLVLSMTDERDWVLDPFMGSGTSVIAALIHNRKSIGAEVMSDYVKMARQRILSAEKGDLRIRPLERPVHDPNAHGTNIPPRLINLKDGASQPELFETLAKYSTRGRG